VPARLLSSIKLFYSICRQRFSNRGGREGRSQRDGRTENADGEKGEKSESSRDCAKAKAEWVRIPGPTSGRGQVDVDDVQEAVTRQNRARGEKEEVQVSEKVTPKHQKAPGFA